MAEVRFEGVGKTFENADTPAIRDLTLTVREGEFMVLVGPSGCGKTTTLRMVAGLEEPTEGSVYIGGRRVNDVAPKDRDIAMVFQNYALYPHMSVRENLAFGLKLRKVPRDEIARRVAVTAELLDIAPYLDRKPKALSGGQRQRVALGRAIVRSPRVFLFDEPLSNLDAKLRVQMRTEIRKLHRSLGATMIYVTHDQVEAMTMGDRITVMRDGTVHQVDAPMRVYARPADLFVAGFIGNPPMNLLPVDVEHGDAPALRFAGRRLPVSDAHVAALAPYAGRAAVLGLRPERIHLSADRCTLPASFPLVHDVTELLGSEAYLHLSVDGFRMVARCDGAPGFAIGAPVEVFCDMAHAQYFDPETERSIDTED